MIRTLTSGMLGAAASTAALALLAAAEGKGPVQPLNATSHWLNGDEAARERRIDLKHTGVGLATHVAATVFWAAFFEAWSVARPTRNSGEIARRAAAIAALAAVVDYTITPKRFTPGWELVLTKRSMALVYAAMAAGFVAARA
jgi:hypothetical protein